MTAMTTIRVNQADISARLSALDIVLDLIMSSVLPSMKGKNGGDTQSRAVDLYKESLEESEDLIIHLAAMLKGDLNRLQKVQTDFNSVDGQLASALKSNSV